jgi:hypothetical protein
MIVVTNVEANRVICTLETNNRVNKTVESEAAPIFTKLFPIKIVEKNDSGFSNIFSNIRAFLFFFLTLRCSLILLRDNNAVSAEEKNALKKTNKIKIETYNNIMVIHSPLTVIFLPLTFLRFFGV